MEWSEGGDPETLTDSGPGGDSSGSGTEVTREERGGTRAETTHGVGRRPDPASLPTRPTGPSRGRRVHGLGVRRGPGPSSRGQVESGRVKENGLDEENSGKNRVGPSVPRDGF